MPLFKYKSVNKNGQAFEGTMEALDRFAIYRSVKESGGTIIYANEVRSKMLTSFLKFDKHSLFTNL